MPDVRVLLVEGDHRLATSLRRGLTEWAMSVHVAHDGEEGLAAALSGEYEVVVLDTVLPLMSGDEVARRLRDRRVHTPILMLTTLDAVDASSAGLHAGADDLLVKPFSQRDLVARILALAQQPALDCGQRLQLGEIVLDTAARVVRVGDVLVELTGREFSILEYLVLNRGRMLTRTQILGHVWHYDFEGAPNLVQVYIGRLRRKLIEAGAADPIVTVRGAGYRFDIPD